MHRDLLAVDRAPPATLSPVERFTRSQHASLTLPVDGGSGPAGPGASKPAQQPESRKGHRHTLPPAGGRPQAEGSLSWIG